MGALVLVVFHVFAVYVGTHFAQNEHTDVWRSVTVALLSYIVMFVVGLLLLPLIAIPLVSQVFGLIVLTAGTAFAAKMVLSCDWKPAWVVGGTAGFLHALAAFVLSGCTHI